MDWRGGMGPPQQQAAAAVPSLLQMAQGEAPGGGGGVDLSQLGDLGGRGGGGGSDSYPHGLYGNEALSPDDKAKYFDAYGGWKMADPEQAAAASGMNLNQLAGGFLPRQNPAVGIEYAVGGDKGGFFNAADLYRKLGRDIPGMATFNQAAPSTNNWRLLGMGPGWIMRNGSLINTLAGQVRGGGSSFSDMGTGITAEHGMGVRRGSALGTGASHGTPNQWGDSFYWPGAATGGYQDRYPSGTNV